MEVVITRFIGEETISSILLLKWKLLYNTLTRVGINLDVDKISNIARVYCMFIIANKIKLKNCEQIVLCQKTNHQCR